MLCFILHLISLKSPISSLLDSLILHSYRNPSNYTLLPSYLSDWSIPIFPLQPPHYPQYTFILVPFVFIASDMSNLSISIFCISLINLFILKFFFKISLNRTSYYFSSVSNFLLSSTLASSFITANFAARTFFKFAFSYSTSENSFLWKILNYVLFLIKFLL